MLGIIIALGVLQDNRLKHDHPLIVPLPSTYHIEFYRYDSHKSPPKIIRRYVIALVWNTDDFS